MRITKQEQALDAAIHLIGTQGIRALTHRAVDAGAGQPAGSTSNYFRTRDALLEGIASRFAALERASWEPIAQSFAPTGAAELGSALALFAQQATGPNRVLTLTRHILFTEAAQRPALQPHLAATAADIRIWGASWLAAIGSSNPDRDCRIVLNYLDGLIIHQLAFPDPAFAPATEITALLISLG